MSKRPERIGRYEIIDRLGSGGMGVVFRAHDPQIGRAVAIKLLRVTEEEFRQRFLQEARAAGGLNHPNIVSIYDVGEHDDQPYLVMEFVAGTTLAEQIQNNVPLSLPRRLEIVEALAEGLEYAHSRGIVHRDVKPANIMIDPDGVVKLLDFGIARLADTGSTRAGLIMGTPNYMSPEQAEGASVDRRSDIFGVGLVLYELLSHRKAFGGGSIPGVLHAILTSDPTPLAELCPGLDPAVGAIVSTALQKQPERRYQTLRSMSADLAEARRKMSAEEAERHTPRPAPVPQGFDALSIEPADLRFRDRTALGDSDSLSPVHLGRRPQPDNSYSTGAVQTAQTSAPAGPISWIRTLLLRLRNLVSRPHLRAGDRSAVEPSGTGAAPDVTQEVHQAPNAGPAGAVEDGTMFLARQADAASSKSGLPDVLLVIARCPVPRHTGRTIELTSTPFTLGRDPDNNVCVSDPGWSRRHASIEFQDVGFSIQDLGSANGTYVNGRRVSGSEPLFFGTSISIGSTVLTFTHGHDSTLPDLIGVEIAGRYHLQRLIRESAKAALYEAADRHVPRHVAIKLLSPELMRYPGYTEQFAREAETASQLQHPHICRVLDSGVASVISRAGARLQTNFLCFELMAGGNLADRLEGIADLGLERIGRWIEMLGSALAYSHQQGVVHGDLKPAAIVFDAAGYLYLTDFAIAQASLSAKGPPILGSPAYIAPEQWENGTITPATDQFAFAALAYYMLTGSKPFEGLDNPDVRAQHFRRGPEPAHEAAARKGRAGVQRAVSEVLDRALSTLAASRYASVDQFSRALGEALSAGRRFGETPQVFVSYDRELSGGWARYFADKLKDRHGIGVFMDTVGLDRAGRFPPRLAKAIAECDVFVCFLAGATLKSKWVNEEIRLAHENRKVMIPIFQESYVDATSEADGPPQVIELISHQGIRLFDIGGHFVDHAVSDLAKMIKGATAGPS